MKQALLLVVWLLRNYISRLTCQLKELKVDISLAQVVKLILLKKVQNVKPVQYMQVAINQKRRSNMKKSTMGKGRGRGRGKPKPRPSR